MWEEYPEEVSNSIPLYPLSFTTPPPMATNRRAHPQAVGRWGQWNVISASRNSSSDLMKVVRILQSGNDAATPPNPCLFTPPPHPMATRGKRRGIGVMIVIRASVLNRNNYE